MLKNGCFFFPVMFCPLGWVWIGIWGSIFLSYVLLSVIWKRILSDCNDFTAKNPWQWQVVCHQYTSSLLVWKIIRRLVFCKVPRQCLKSGTEEVNSCVTLDVAVWKATWVKRLLSTSPRLSSLIFCSMFFQPTDSPYLSLLHCLSWGNAVKKRSVDFSSLLWLSHRSRTL